ncbi:hypothetical protein [Bacillus sp. SN10]|uniref:hypothetical protein n=1 Tax=Bacillus sp. SN10 TaxID=2056493 RepID=UPI000C3498F0|nr:hypothetical protein [Bacillus sp. SN10]PKJ55671.1 hypothetical protein CWE34_12705 [Bacillus sp. SN10]
MDRYVTRTAQQVWDTWGSLDEIWTGANYKEYNLLVVSGEDAWVISTDKKIKKIASNDLPMRFSMSGLNYSYQAPTMKYDGKPTIKVEVAPDMFKEKYDNGEFEALPASPQLFTFTTHEEFHHYQDNWKVDKIEPEKVEELTGNKEARKIRLELLASLRMAVIDTSKEKEHLAAAKYWFDTYKKNHPEDYKTVRGMDVLEGTARYFDMAVNVRSNIGMNASKEEVYQKYKDLIEKDYTLNISRIDGFADSESYDLGGAAGVLLEKNKKDKSWQKEAENGTSLVEILLKDVKSVPQQPSQEIEKLIKEIAEKQKEFQEENK